MRNFLFSAALSLLSGAGAIAQISVSGYNHVALSVKDLDASARFYRDVMGLTPVAVPENLRAIRAWFRIGPGQELHLLAGRGNPVANNGPNGAHFSLTIPDADDAEALLKAEGLKYLRQQRFDGAWQIFLSDPDGYFIELNEPKPEWRPLFNGVDLAGWDTYLGPQFPPDSEDRTGVAPVGLNTDPKKVFSMGTEEGLPVLRISGEHFGGISTAESFDNYHLQVQFRWGKLKWHPRQNAKMDSGILYHANGEHGLDWGFWMQSQEFQVQEGDCGDYWGLVGAGFDIPAVQRGPEDWQYEPGAARQLFSEKSPAGRHCIRAADAEKPAGEWNTLDLYCVGDTAVHVVNGKTVMVLYHSHRPAPGGSYEPLTRGKIQIQTEGAEVFYRNMRVRTIGRIPNGLMDGK